MRAPFIAIEGGDGAGKSTQIERLANNCRDQGLAVTTTREPGGTPAAEAIRTLIVQGQSDRFSARAEMLLVYAARADHLEKLINPARARGDIVITDRFSTSTRAYQGHAGGADLGALESLETLIVGDDKPDLTIVLDLPIDIGLQRALRVGNTDTRFESKGAAYHEAVRAGFLAVVQSRPHDHVVIDAARSLDAIASDIRVACAPLIERWQREPFQS